MKLVFSFILLFNLNLFASDELVGSWKFTEYIYEGATHPIPNPNLDLRFTFDRKGHSLLEWFRTDEEGFCQRLGNYKVTKAHWLVQKTVWVNPANDVACANDLEMHLGYQTRTQFKLVNQKLWLKLALNGEDFIYVFTSVE